MYDSASKGRQRCLGVSLILFLCMHGSAQQVPTRMPLISYEGIRALRSGELTVWECGSGVLLGWATIQNALKADFPDLQVKFRVVAPDHFMADINAAKESKTLPDVVFVDNWSQGAQLVAQQRVVEMIGRARFWATGWWFQMLAGPEPDSARAFLRWLEDSPHWQPPRMSTQGMTELDNQQVTSASLLAVAGIAGGGAVDPVMDPDASPHFTMSWGTACGQITWMSFPVIRFLYGNGRIAYAAVASEASSSGSAQCTGVMYTYLVLRKRPEGWKVLLLTPHVTLELAVSFARQLDQLRLASGDNVSPYPPLLISPIDGERQTRYPKQYLSWQQNVPQPVAYGVEWRFGSPSGNAASFSPSAIEVYPSINYGDVVRIPMPFGIGVQPHRWRIWAIGDDGQIALSEWRTINFTN